ncbi:DUF2929 family protein [Oceanobacillus chungangensis]|uniref:DUF2929 domain-containing protein n=1 Tax=Oceanobacillus chungangensis TaxID=1229152 RepID=A0A3D8PXU0_9BACI|nr:DUF2929 family protein [Oceanobacillus chungangensis]RDW19959.1 DUF2929 domain-containing protein [Oceanobacillus chungangensis]
MRYIMTIFWSVVVSLAIAFVLSSMGGEPFVLSDGLLLAAILAVAAIILGDGILKEEKN